PTGAPPLSLHDALPICARAKDRRADGSQGDPDLAAVLVDDEAETGDRDHHGVARADLRERTGTPDDPPARAEDELIGPERAALRSEEHTSELQSPDHLV